MEDLNDLATECHRIAVQHGFWDHMLSAKPNPSIWAEKVALIHSEASEMLECLRKRKSEDELALECADVLIRLLDFTSARGLDIDRAVHTKMIYNRGRKHLHGGNF